MEVGIWLRTQSETYGFAILGRPRKCFCTSLVLRWANAFSSEIDEHDQLAASQPVVESK